MSEPSRSYLEMHHAAYEAKRATAMKKKRIIYSRGFPYGAPLVMLRGGGTKQPEVKAFLKEQKFQWNPGRFAWETYMDRSDFGPILKTLRDEYGCEVMPKEDMDTGYLIDLDSPDFSRPQ